MAKTSKSSKNKKSAGTNNGSPMGVTGGPSCQCGEADDGQFYCFKKVQGRWVPCRGPYDSLEECKDKTGEKCGG